MSICVFSWKIYSVFSNMLEMGLFPFQMKKLYFFPLGAYKVWELSQNITKCSNLVINGLKVCSIITKSKVSFSKYFILLSICC